MFSYESRVSKDLERWKKEMRRPPSVMQSLSKGTQRKINRLLPEKYHEVITSAIKSITTTVLYGTGFASAKPLFGLPLEEIEKRARDKGKFYAATAAIEGAATGAGGFVSSLADFPLLMGIKMKFLYEMASLYGFDTNDYTERLYLLQIFQLSFSSKAYMNKVFKRIENWDEYAATLPRDLNEFDWRSFQQEYRDYLDLAKLLQMLPVIGAVVGSYVNNKLLKKLLETSMNCYRIRVLK
jgi:hypothetical protein